MFNCRSFFGTHENESFFNLKCSQHIYHDSCLKYFLNMDLSFDFIYLYLAPTIFIFYSKKLNLKPTLNLIVLQTLCYCWKWNNAVFNWVFDWGLQRSKGYHKPVGPQCGEQCRIQLGTNMDCIWSIWRWP